MTVHPPSSHALGDRAWPSLGGGGLLVPVGATEQHGPHLPVDTDSVIAGAVAHAVAERLVTQGVAVVVAPTLAFGASGEHAGFPGTVSIGTDALRQVLVELARSVRDWADWIVFVSAHGGNAVAVAGAVGQLRDEGHEAGWVPCATRGADAHAGRTETSLMLHLAPSRVDMTVAEVGNTLPVGQLMPMLREHGVRALSPSGVLGDPRSASAAEGHRLLGEIVDDHVRRISLFVADDRGLLVGVP